MAYALWRALAHAISDGRDETGTYPVQRAAFVVVFLVAVHSMLEYPLWYAYFLLPTAFAFGLCLERPVAREAAGGDDEYGNVTRPYVLAAMFLVLGGTLALYDYMRVVVIFAPPIGAGPLEERIAGGRKSVLFAPPCRLRGRDRRRASRQGGERVRSCAALPARRASDGGVGAGRSTSSANPTRRAIWRRA